MVKAATQNKERRLTKKQRGFVNEFADTGNATQAIKKHYKVKNDLTARVMGSENLTKPNIQEELRKLGFDSNNAKRVISEILNDDSLEPKDRIKAAENVFKVHGDFAPEKTLNISLQVSKEEREKMLGLSNKMLDEMTHEEVNG